MMLLLLPLAIESTSARSLIQVEADFVQFLRPPGSMDEIIRPSAIHSDRRNGEVLVGDPGNGRIVIFDNAGTYRFEFSGMEHFSVPMDITVESEGYILVLASTMSGRRIQRFDFDGLFVETLPIEDSVHRLSSIDVDDAGRIYVLRAQTGLVTIHSTNGEELERFSASGEAAESEHVGLVFGQIRVFGSTIFVPVSSGGYVETYELDGTYKRRIGSPGAVVATLSFPVAVDVATDGTVLVLDKNRFTILCYDRWGKFLGEFGGKGYSPGWFFYPSLLAVDESDKVYIGQLMDNKLQVCRIPEVIRPHLRRPEPEASPHGPSDGGQAVGWFDTELPERSGWAMTAAYGRTLASGRSDDLSLMTPAFYQIHLGGGQ